MEIIQTETQAEVVAGKEESGEIATGVARQKDAEAEKEAIENKVKAGVQKGVEDLSIAAQFFGSRLSERADHRLAPIMPDDEILKLRTLIADVEDKISLDQLPPIINKLVTILDTVGRVPQRGVLRDDKDNFNGVSKSLRAIYDACDKILAASKLGSDTHRDLFSASVSLSEKSKSVAIWAHKRNIALSEF